MIVAYISSTEDRLDVKNVESSTVKRRWLALAGVVSTLLIGIGVIAWFGDVLFEDWLCQNRFGRVVRYGCHSTWEDSATYPMSYKAPLLQVTFITLLLASLVPWVWIISVQRKHRRGHPSATKTPDHTGSGNPQSEDPRSPG